MASNQEDGQEGEGGQQEGATGTGNRSAHASAEPSMLALLQVTDSPTLRERGVHSRVARGRPYPSIWRGCTVVGVEGTGRAPMALELELQRRGPPVRNSHRVPSW